MSSIYRLHISPSLLNSSCPWASSQLDLEALYKCKYTGAVTTRTSTMKGFEENIKVHKVAFAKDSMVSLNSYGYSPYPLSSYIGWVEYILTSSETNQKKPFIISITSSDPQELSEMVEQIQQLRASLSDSSDSSEVDIEGHSPTNLIAIELNTSCPNIPSHPPPAYHVPTLRPLLESFAQAFRKDKTLTLGLKLAPFVYRKQQEDILDLISEFTDEDGKNPIAFLSSTNTLGGCTLFTDQTGKINGATQDPRRTGFTDGSVSVSTALPTKFGGLAGDPLHYLSLGNVLAFSELIASHPDPAVRRIGIIGIGGVTSHAAYQRMKQAGAYAVACATALGLQGVSVFEKLLGAQRPPSASI